MQQQPEISLTLETDELAALEQIRQAQGLSSVDMAAEWLLKTSLRRAASRASGGTRKLRLVVHHDGSPA
jgi:hypothetical protein